MPTPREKIDALLKDPHKLVFGTEFTDHCLIRQYADGEWGAPWIQEGLDVSFHLASSVFHYGQELFEGLKAYYGTDGKIRLFRPEMNARRMNSGCERLVMPTQAEEEWVRMVEDVVRRDAHWVPKLRQSSLYIRPTMIGVEKALGVKPASSCMFFIILSPVGPYYKTFDPVKIGVETDFVRAAPGGTGDVKAGGNYASSLLAAKLAKKRNPDYQQVLWLDAVERKYVEEVGAMNVMYVFKDGSVGTAELAGTILPGVTRDSVITLLREQFGREVREGKFDVAEIVSGIDSGEVVEIFGTGTAAAISPVAGLGYNGEFHEVGGGKVGELTQKLYDTLLDIQYGDAEDQFGWTRVIEV